MNRSLLLIFLATMLVGVALARGGNNPNNGRKPKGGRRGAKGNEDAASAGNWTWGKCVPKHGDCGRGAMAGSCSGAGCTAETAEKPCRVRCPVTTEASPAENFEEVEAITAEPDTVHFTNTTEETPRPDGEKEKGGKKPNQTGGRGNKSDREGRMKPGKKPGNKPIRPVNKPDRPVKPSLPGNKRGRPGKSVKPDQDKDCRYNGATFSDCDPHTNRRNKTHTLRSGDPAVCQEEIVHTVRCDRNPARQGIENCTYSRATFSDCDPETNRQNKTQTLISGDPAVCQEEIVHKVRCDRNPARKEIENCTYNRATFSDCDPETNRQNKTHTLRSGDPAFCQAEIVHKVRCDRMAARQELKNCTYSTATFSDCDPLTNRQNKTRTLMIGDPAVCQEEIVHTVRCDKNSPRHENRKCDYTIGEFGECNTTTKRRYRIDTLVNQSQASEGCRLERTVGERCSNKDCVYNWDISECSRQTKLVSVTGTLVNIEGAPSHCELTVIREFSCKNGKDRCKLGEWRSYGACNEDGVKTRTRKLLKGGQACLRLTKEHMTC